MPVSITKASVLEEIIYKMVQKAFACEPKEITELTEGFYNVAYRINLGNRTVILKVAPSPEVEILTCEKNIMWAEVDSMRMAREKTGVPVPQIFFYDDSRELCERPYFFMEELNGRNFFTIMETMSEEEKANIFRQAGRYTKELNQMTGDKFGYYGQPDCQGDNWYEVFYSMILNAFFDLERKNIAVPVEKEKLLAMLEADKDCFVKVTTPKYVHWDIWAGNIFVEDGKVTGIIDFERALWADELMEVGFRTYEYNKDFFEGYERADLNAEETRRALWYDMYLFLLMRTECDYRGYEHRWHYDWSGEMIEKWVELLESGGTL